MTNNQYRKRNSRGVALISALGLLVIFSMFGLAFIDYMLLESENTQIDIDSKRAKQLSDGGIHAAAGVLRTADQPSDSYDFNINAYRMLKDQVREPHQQLVRVSVVDESGKVNLNHASDELLEALGIPASAINDLNKAIEKRPLVHVDDLIGRNILKTNKQFNALDKSNFTVYGNGALNVNVASPKVLAAALGMTVQEGEALAAKRPFTSWEDLVAKSGKDAWGFNVEATVQDGAQTPKGISLKSTCFRLVSSVDMTIYTSTTPSQTEAVVVIDGKGDSSIQYWAHSTQASSVAKAFGNDDKEEPAPASDEAAEADNNKA